MKNRIRTLFLFLTLSLLFLISGCQSNSDSKRFEKQKTSLTDHIGEQIKISNILDSSGNQVKLDLTKSDLTIIDFWFNNCPPCIKELNQFASILVGKEKKISVISISINQPWLWHETLKTHTGRFIFLENKLSNWAQYVLNTVDNEKLKNDISIDRVLELQSTYNVTFFPAYFVVDRNGIIQERPESAVDYIKQL
jgi:cytochrome oxidase Cu insertion factor (SCO1/SenC/PrrC family)